VPLACAATGGGRAPAAWGIAADASGNVYFTNACGVGAIRSDGTFAIVAGNLNSCGYAGNNALFPWARPLEIAFPSS
jgi:hypothetical protein